MLHGFTKKVVRSVCGQYYRIRSARLTEEALTVFCFHDVSNDPSEFSLDFDLNVYPGVFDYQIGFIRRHFNIISPDDLSRDSIPKHAALITFDDGFLSFFTNAVPLLNKHQVPALIFLNMEPIQGGKFWAGLITYLCSKRDDFVPYLRQKIAVTTSSPLFLHCSKAIVDSYLDHVQNDFDAEVFQYVGPFAREEHLQSVESNRLVYFGNHLYNHYVPRLMSDKEILLSFKDNVDCLKKYSNYRNIFSFPFGQPKSCFADGQVQLIHENCTQTMFSSSQHVNYTRGALLDRISLSSSHKTSTDLWFQIFKHRIKDRLHSYS